MLIRLRSSLYAIYASLEKPKIARRGVACLLVIHTVLLSYSAYVHSPTLNEPGHLVAGLSYWKFGRFDVYKVNPPLTRMIASLPTIAAGYKEDWSGFDAGLGARPEMRMGEDFVAANGERSFALFTISRWACIPISWLGAITCYLWARDLYGRPPGVLACLIWCFEPNILAHASLITPDISATALGLAACYTFWQWLRNPTWLHVAITGIVLGLAELAKTTLILLYPLWPLMWLIYRWRDRHRMQLRDWLSQAGMLGVRIAIGLYVVNLGYGFEGSCTRIRDYVFVSELFKGTLKDPELPDPASKRLSTDKVIDDWLCHLPVPLPKQYVLGIDLQQRDFETYGKPSYLRGEWREHGWWYYYLYGVTIKVPLGLWAMGLAAIVFVYLRWPTPQIDWRDEFVLLLPAVVIFAVVSANTGFNEHLRYILPALPSFYIFASGSARTLQFADASPNTIHGGPVRFISPKRISQASFSLAPGCIIAFGAWMVTSSLWIYPHSLSYFNEAVGGPINGPYHLLGSNVDWGQDLRLLDWYTKKHPSCSPIGLSYFGGVNPMDLGINSEPLVPTYRPSKGRRDSLRVQAISVNLLFGYPADTSAEQLSAILPAKDKALVERPGTIGRAGYTIYIFGEPLP